MNKTVTHAMKKRLREDCSFDTSRARLLFLFLVASTIGFPHGGRLAASEHNVKTTASRILGKQLTYDVRYQSEGYTELGDAVVTSPGATAPSRHNLSGTLDAVEIVTVLGHEHSRVRASVRFQAPIVTIKVDSKRQPAKEREVAENLGYLVTIYLDAEARVTRLEFPNQYSPMAVNFAKAIITLQQYVVPFHAEKSASNWDTEENSSNGKYSAHYQVVETSDSLRRVTKTFAASRSHLNEGANLATPIQIIPGGRIQLDVSRSEGTVQKLDGVFHEDMLIEGHVLASQKTSVTARIVSKVPLSAADLSTAERNLAKSHQPLKTLERARELPTLDKEKAMQQQILGTDSLHSLLDGLSQIDEPSISEERRMTLYLKLKALIYLHPEAASALGHRLFVADLSRPSSEMIITAFSAVGSPEAQSELCRIISSKKEDLGSLTSLVPVLGSFHQPNDQVVSQLQIFSNSPSRDVKSMAILALGAVARNLSQESSKRSNAIVSELATRFSESALLDDKTTLLLALGNSHSEKAESIILSQTRNTSQEIRRTAVVALGDFQSKTSLVALCDTLRNDADPQIRSAAAQALGSRNGITLAKDTLLHAAQEDMAESVRIASMFALTDQISRNVQVRRVISDLSEQDQSSTVRKQAASLLRKENAP